MKKIKPAKKRPAKPLAKTRVVRRSNSLSRTRRRRVTSRSAYDVYDVPIPILNIRGFLGGNDPPPASSTVKPKSPPTTDTDTDTDALELLVDKIATDYVADYLDIVKESTDAVAHLYTKPNAHNVNQAIAQVQARSSSLSKAYEAHINRYGASVKNAVAEKKKAALVTADWTENIVLLNTYVKNLPNNKPKNRR